jgi:hypothetical protein
MKITIVPEDSCIYLDKLQILGVNLSDMPTGIHAVQWNERGETNTGHIEYTDERVNETITDISIFNKWINRALNKVEQDKIEQDRIQEENSKNQPQPQSQPLTQGTVEW